MARSNAPAADAVTTYQYYPSGQLKYQSGALTYPVAYAYDYQGRMTSMTTWKSDAEAGNLSAPSAATTQWVYDANGQLWKKIYPAFDENGDGQTTEPAREVVYTYDDIGRLATRTWARGAVTSYIYHPYTGDLIYTDYADNAVTRDLEYRYDRAGRPIEVNEGTLTGTPEFYLTLENIYIYENLGASMDSATDLPSWLIPPNLMGWDPVTGYVYNYLMGTLPVGMTGFTSAYAPSYMLWESYSFSGFYDENNNPIWGGTTWFYVDTNASSGTGFVYESDVFSATGETHLYTYESGPGKPPTEKILGRVDGRIVETFPIHQEAPDPLAWSSYQILTVPTAGGTPTTEMEVTFSPAANGRLGRVDSNVRHESRSLTALQPYSFTYDYDLPGDGTLLHRRNGPETDVPNGSGGVKRAYTTTHTYEAGRDGLLEMKNELNVGLVTNPNTTPMTRGNPWTAARHQYELNTLGQRTSHEETLSEAGNFNGWVGYDRRVKRDFVYDAKGQVTAATAAYPNGNNASAGYGFLGDPASEAEVYSYDAIGNRTGAQFPKRSVDASGNLEYGWNFGTPPATGESNTYPATSKANTYGAVNRTNQGYASGTAPPAAATLKYDADGNLLEDGEFVYTWDSENRLLSIDPVAPTPGAYGECRYRFGYDYRSRRVRRQVDFWAGIWLTKTVNRFVYHGWNLALDYHQDFCVYNDTVGQTEGIDKGSYGGGLSPVRTDRYIWGQDVSGTLQGAGGVGGLLMAVANPTNPWWFDNNTLLPSIAYSYLYDGNGNVTSLLHEHGFVLCQYRYDSFGNQLGQCINHYIAPDGTIPCLMEQPFRFSTKWLDQTDGLQLAYGPHPKNRTLYYYGYRYYTPQQGRWLGRDPIEEQGGVNLFGMCGNDAVIFVDRLGEDIVPGQTYKPSVEGRKAAVTGKPKIFSSQVLEGEKIDFVAAAAKCVSDKKDLLNLTEEKKVVEAIRKMVQKGAETNLNEVKKLFDTFFLFGHGATVEISGPGEYEVPGKLLDGGPAKLKADGTPQLGLYKEPLFDNEKYALHANSAGKHALYQQIHGFGLPFDSNLALEIAKCAKEVVFTGCELGNPKIVNRADIEKKLQKLADESGAVLWVAEGSAHYKWPDRTDPSGAYLDWDAVKWTKVTPNTK